MNYLHGHGTRATPQTTKAKKGQRRNEAGGFVWTATPWQRLARILVLGSEGGSYYVSERKLTTQNVKCLRECIEEDGPRTVAEIRMISVAGRAPKNDAALFALANCISLGDKQTRRLAAEALPLVARTGTHLYHFVAYAEGLRGWGRTMRWAVSNWYNMRPLESLAFQAIKYRQRDGWSHRDLLRLAHPETATTHAAVYDWITHPSEPHLDKHALIAAFEAAQHPDCTAKQAAALVLGSRLPREALQTQHLNDPEVWHALVESGMPITAMIRNLPTMTRHGVLQGDSLRIVLETLRDAYRLKQARVHPMSLLIALSTYTAGQGRSRERQWVPMHQITDALDEAFYLSFGNVEGSGKRTLLAIDISGSMGYGHYLHGHGVAGSTLSPRMAAAALAMVHLHAEPQIEIVGIDSNIYGINISKRQRLDDVMKAIPQGGRTNLALPYLHANPVNGPEVFITHVGGPTTLIEVGAWRLLTVLPRDERREARAIACAMVANKWSINDPDDPLSSTWWASTQPRPT
jgi:60 kDa SS-A/Ro ribonucleoprotein